MYIYIYKSDSHHKQKELCAGNNLPYSFVVILFFITFVPDITIKDGMVTEEHIFHRAALLLGDDAMEHIGRQRVIIFGVGGVGSWCAEGLVRSGVRQLTIVDSDCVCASNINRQLMATTANIGHPKVEVLRERLLAINPSAEVVALQKVFCEGTADEFRLDDYDFIIDAIDSLKDKALLILMATATQAHFFSSMGAALKMDPSRIRVTEFWKVTGDPLARALRHRFKRNHCFPQRKFKCVYSDELLKNRDVATGEEGTRVNGSLVHITAIFGLTLASMVIREISSMPLAPGR